VPEVCLRSAAADHGTDGYGGTRAGALSLTNEEGVGMGLDDKVKQAVGKAKETVGDATDNEELEREGRAEQGEAKVEGAADDIKRGFSNAKDRLT